MKQQKLDLMKEGWLGGVAHIASENFDDRPADCHISLLVIHAISLPPSRFGSDDVIKFFTNTLDPDAHPYFQTIHKVKVSAHFFIRRTGQIIQFVSCDKRAWHAGASTWQGRTRCNDFSIGVELEGCDEHAFDAIQYDVLNNLISVLHTYYPLDAIAGHSDIAPDRKTDPGPFFKWEKVNFPPLKK